MLDGTLSSSQRLLHHVGGGLDQDMWDWMLAFGDSSFGYVVSTLVFVGLF